MALLILKKEGVAGFYKGLLPGVIKSAPASAITFAVYEATMVALSAMNAGERRTGVWPSGC